MLADNGAARKDFDLDVAAGLLFQIGGHPLQSVALIAQGRANREIAVETGLAEGTVKLHVSGVLKRTGLRNCTEIAHHALNGGLL